MPKIIIESHTIRAISIIILIYLFSYIFEKIINKRIKNTNLKHLSRKWVHYGKLLLSIYIVGSNVNKGQFDLSTIIGFASAGIALALHPVLLNIAGWLLLIIKKTYTVGDRIETAGSKGDIIDIRMFYTILLEVGSWEDGEQSTGRILNIPNSKVFTERHINFTTGFDGIWNEIKILITFDSNKDKAKDILIDIAYKMINTDILQKIELEQVAMAKKYALKTSKLTPIVYLTINPSGIQLELRYLTTVRNRRGIQTKISEAIYDAFKIENDIEFAYPSQRIYFNN